MNDFGPYGYGDSAINYDAMRRRRARVSWSVDGRQGLQGYAQYLAGGVGPEASGVIAAEIDAAAEPSWLRPIFIGVATSACAFIVNRWLGRIFK